MISSLVILGIAVLIAGYFARAKDGAGEGVVGI